MDNTNRCSTTVEGISDWIREMDTSVQLANWNSRSVGWLVVILLRSEGLNKISLSEQIDSLQNELSLTLTNSLENALHRKVFVFNGIINKFKYFFLAD